MKNYYAILEVSEDATRDEIKQAYIDHICYIHPDLFEKDTTDWTNATQLLSNINEAYACLSDPERREEYDASLAQVKADEDADRPDFANMHKKISVLLTLALLCVAVLLFFFSPNSPNESAPGDSMAAAVAPVGDEGADEPDDERSAADLPGGDQTSGDLLILSEVPKERPMNRATASDSFKYVQLINDEFYEILLEVDSTQVFDGGNIVTVWTKHVRDNRTRNTAIPRLETPSAYAQNVGWFLTQNICNLQKDEIALLKIMYFDKNGAFIGGSTVQDKQIRWTRVKQASAERIILNWIKSAVRATEKIEDQHRRAIRMGSAIVAMRDKKLEADYSYAARRMSNFNVKKGGTITTPYAFCRKIPTTEAPIIQGRLVRGTPVFVTKRYVDDAGRTWYYVEHINASGWVANRNLRVY